MRKCLIGILVLPTLLVTATEARPVSATPSIRYKLELRNPGQRRLHVTCRVAGIKERNINFSFPSWSPGSYVYRPLSRFLRSLNVTGPDGPLPFAPGTTDTYQVSDVSRASLTIDYDIDLSLADGSVDKSLVNDQIAVIKGDFTFCLIRGLREAPALVEVEPPQGWKLITTLTRDLKRNCFRATNYDELIDSTAMMGRIETATFSSGPANFTIAIDGSMGLAPTHLIAAAKRLADYEISLFGKPPFGHYTFFVYIATDPSFNILPSGVVGMEHLRGCTVFFTPDGARLIKGDDFDRVIQELFAHELFHSWNGKLIHPVELDRPDLTRPIMSPNIWFIEGVTHFYDIMARYRTGLTDKQRLYNDLSLLMTAGNVSRSLKMASLDVDKTLDSMLYSKGALAALDLDLKIRSLSRGRRSLYDVMRMLYRRFGLRSRSYTAASLREIAAQAAGRNLDDFFSRYIYEAERFDTDAALAAAGLKAERYATRAAQDIGIFFDNKTKTVVGVLAGSAAESAGLRQQDKILSIDGISTSSRPFVRSFPRTAVGDTYKLQTIRNNQEVTIDMRIGTIEIPRLKITEAEHSSVLETRVRASFLSAVPAGMESRNVR